MQLIFFFLLGMISTTDQAPIVPNSEFGRPDFNSNNQMIMAIDGNLWLGNMRAKDLAKTKWTQLSTGTFDDRNPIWMPDDEHILFSSNRNGQYDLWTLNVSNKKLEVWHESPEQDTEPSVADNGAVVWVKGVGPQADLWMKNKDEEAEQLTKLPGAEISPDWSPDAKSVVFVYQNGRSHELKLLPIGKKAMTLLSRNNPEFPQFSPSGKRIIYSTRGQSNGVWISDVKGSYHNYLSKERARASWTTDAKQLALVPMVARPPYHNGDQDIDGKRYLESVSEANAYIKFLEVPAAPDENLNAIDFTIPDEWQQRVAKDFEELSQRFTEKYQKTDSNSQKQWAALMMATKKKVSAAGDEAEARKHIFQLLQDKPHLRSEQMGRAGVSSAHPLASEAGTTIFAQGGNVVDAAIAVSFALGVVEPDASGIGGYGEMMIHLQDMESPTCIEFLTRVPEAASLSNGKLNPLPQGGPVMVNIPGTVAGMELAWKRYGSKKVKWADILAPAIKLAKEGFILDESLTTTLFKEQEQYRKYPSSRKLFFKDGEPLKPGMLFKNPDLAWTLEQIAKGGAKAFYEGAIAEKMVKDLRGQGNVMSMEDMARYYAVEREPVSTTYRGHTIYAGPPPVSGGTNLVGQLNMLEGYSEMKAYAEDAASFHAMIEAWKMTPSGRGRIADPGLWPVDLSVFKDKEAAQKRWSSCFNPLQAMMSEQDCNNTAVGMSMGADKVLDAKSNTGTTSFSVADADGNLVSVTQTLGTWGGNFYVTPGLGFLYNDKLGSYSTNPKSYNARVPFARNVTSITPTIVFKGVGDNKEPLVALGAAGNAWITAAVYQIVSGIIDQGLSPQEAIEQPRFLVGVRRNRQNPKEIESVNIQIEDGFAPGVLQALRNKGHQFQLISRRGEIRMGYASVVMLKDGSVIAAGDPRRSGEGRVVK